jgi:hypothetical protein
MGVPNQTGEYFTNTCSFSAVHQKELVQTLTVSSTTGTLASSIALQSGQLYEIKVTGTYTYINLANGWADAEYFFTASGLTKGDSLYPLTPNILDLSIHSCSTNTDWGEYQPSHVYNKQWTGDGGPLSFCIYDTYDQDNVGSLTVEIWKVNW